MEHPTARRRFLAGALALAVLALGVRLGWIPVARHEFRLHEHDYLQVFRHDWSGPWSTRVVPALGHLYRALGAVTEDERVLVAVSVLAGLLGIGAVATFLRRTSVPSAALLAALFLALHGTHAAWSTSAYHVILPGALAWTALALLAGPGGDARAARPWPPLLAGLLLGLGAGMRPELGVFALPSAWLLRGRDPAPLAAWLLPFLAVFAMSLLPLRHAGAHPEGLVASVPLALATNLRSPLFLRPWTTGWTLIPALALGTIGGRAFPRAGGPLALVLGATFLSAAAFADAGERHLLPAGMALDGLLALGLVALWGAAPLRRAATVLVAAGVLALHAWDTARLARDYHAPPARMAEVLAAAAPGPAAVDGCTFVSEQLDLPGQDLPSHARVRDFQRCVLWEEDTIHRAWSSLGIHDRARRMHALYHLEPLGLTRSPGGFRQVWRLHGRRSLLASWFPLGPPPLI